MKIIKKIAIVALLFSLVGCNKANVKPWQKGDLARDDMALNADALDLSIDDHIYFSKESSSGGRGFAGGGCGCN